MIYVKKEITIKIIRTVFDIKINKKNNSKQIKTNQNNKNYN